MTDLLINNQNATKRVKVTLAGQEVISVSADVVVEVPQDTTDFELTGLGAEAIGEAVDHWHLGDIEDRDVDQIVEMQLCDCEPDIKLVRGSDGNLIPAEE